MSIMSLKMQDLMREERIRYQNNFYDSLSPNGKEKFINENIPFKLVSFFNCSAVFALVTFFLKDYFNMPLLFSLYCSLILTIFLLMFSLNAEVSYPYRKLMIKLFVSKKKKEKIILEKKDRWIFESFISSRISEDFVRHISEYLTKEQLKNFLKASNKLTYLDFIDYCNHFNLFMDDAYEDANLSLEKKKRNKIVNDFVEKLHQEKVENKVNGQVRHKNK